MAAAKSSKGRVSCSTSTSVTCSLASAFMLVSSASQWLLLRGLLPKKRSTATTIMKDKYKPQSLAALTHQLRNRSIFSEVEEHSVESYHLYRTLIPFPHHHPPLEVGDVLVAHPLKGIRPQS